MNDKKIVRWPYIVCGMILFIFIGVVYAWSLFAGPLESEYGWTRQNTSMVFTISMSFFAIGNIAGGFTANKRSLRFNILISASCLLIGFVGSSFVSEIWHLYITYGVFAGFASGFSYGPTINTIVKWFPDKPGTASGLLLVAFGLSTIVVGTPIAALFGAIGVSKTFLLMGIVFPVAMVIAVMFIKSPTQDESFPEPRFHRGRILEPAEDLRTSQVLRRPSLWFFLLWSFGMVTSGYAVIGHAATSAASIGATVAMATITTSGLSIANGLSRVIWGILCDTLGMKKVQYIINATMAVGYVMGIAALLKNSSILLTVGLIIAGAAYGGAIAYAPPFFREMYGTTYYASNYSLYYLVGVPNAVAGPMVMAYVYAQSKSYLLAYIIILTIILFCSVFIGAIRKPARNTKRCSKGEVV